MNRVKAVRREKLDKKIKAKAAKTICSFSIKKVIREIVLEFEIIDTDNTRVRARSLYQVEEESLINRDGKVFRNPFIR